VSAAGAADRRPPPPARLRGADETLNEVRLVAADGLLYRMYKDGPVYDLLRSTRLRLQARGWKGQRTATKVPRLIKERTVAEYARRFSPRVFVETGTFRGDMLFSNRRRFDRLYSVELDPALYQAAVRRFARHPQVSLRHGDSGQMLPAILAELAEPALFWLDAHYSGGVTARGAIDTPIVQEMERIFTHPVRGHVVLVDDAHEFVGANGYPTMDEFEAYVKERRPEWTVEVWNNIIRMHPAAGRP